MAYKALCDLELTCLASLMPLHFLDAPFSYLPFSRTFQVSSNWSDTCSSYFAHAVPCTQNALIPLFAYQTPSSLRLESLVL